MENRLKKDGWVLDPDHGFVGHVGGLWRLVTNGETQFAFIAKDFHANRNGVVHGGMIMTFVDRAMGQTARTVSGAPRGATISLTHQFLAPVRIGDLVTMTPRVTKMTSRMVFLDGSACVGDDPVVTTQGLWRITHTT